MRSADTKHEIEDWVRKISSTCPLGAQYFVTSVDHQHAYQYALNEKGVATHGFKTSQIVECANGVFVPARAHTPYRANNMIVESKHVMLDRTM